MKCHTRSLVLLSVSVFVLATGPVYSQALLQDLFPTVTSGIQQGLSSVREGFSRFVSSTPLSNFMSSSPFRGFLSGSNRRSGNFFDSVPLVGSCDRIAYQGVANCLRNFRPTTIGSKGQCCAWRKYRACINGLRSGVRWAAQADRCPSHSFSRATINSISDRLAGFPLSACGSNPCGSRG